MSPRPVIHGRDHAPGGADPAYHAWEDVGAGAGAGGALSHADLFVTDGLFWWNGSSSSTLAAGAIGLINFTPGNLFTNDTTTFTIDQYSPTAGGNFKSVHGLGIHTVPGTYNFYCGVTANVSSPPASPWGRSVPFQLVCLNNTQLSGPDQSGQYMTFVPIGSAGGGYWQALFYQRVIVYNDTNSYAGTPAPFTLEIDNPTSGNGGFTLTGCYGFIAVDKIADDNGGYFSKEMPGLFNKIQWGDGLTVTDEGSGVIRVDAGALLDPWIVSIQVTDPAASALTTGNGKAYFRVPDKLNGLKLTACAAHVITVSSSGKPSVQIHNDTAAVDILSTVLSIDASEIDSVTASVPAVINAANNTVHTADELRIDCTVAGTGAKGLIVEMQFS